MKVRFLILVLALSTLVGPGPARAYNWPVPTEPTAVLADRPMSRYVDPDFGFSFLYPQDWGSIPGTRRGGSVDVTFIDYVPVGGVNSSVTMEAGAFRGVLDDWMDSIRQAAEARPNGVFEPYQERTGITEVPVQLYSAKYDQDDGNTAYVVGLGVVSAGISYNFYTSASIEAIQADDGTLASILDSLRIR